MKITTKTKWIPLVFLLAATLTGLVGSAAVFADEGAADDSATPSTAPYRGFTVQGLDPAYLTEAATKWHADIVRDMIRPQFLADHHYHCTNAEAWAKIMADLPAGLDEAKKLHLAVVLCLFEVPIPHFPKGGEEKAALHAFWTDDNNLKAMAQCWTQIAKICADRDQVIWFDLKNEPLDWADSPSFPKNWPAWAQSLIDTIRQIDQRHQIVIEPGPGGMPSGFKTFPMLKGTGLIYSFHQYLPHTYTMQGVKSTKSTDLAHPYLTRQLNWPGTFPDSGGGLWDKQRLEKELQPAVDFQKRYGVRIYVGEFSVARWAPDATQWLRDSMDIFEAHGWDWTYHALHENQIWSLEYNDSYDKPADLENTDQLSDRGQLLMDYLSRNLKQPPASGAN